MYWDRYPEEPYVPQRGDLIFGPAALYEVLNSRPVESSAHPDRWHLTFRRIGNNGPDLLDHLARRPEARAHGRRILNEPWTHHQRANQVLRHQQDNPQPNPYTPPT